MTPRLPIPGADSDTWGEILNDFLSVSHDTDGTVKPEAVTTTALQDSSVSGTKLQDTSVTSMKLDAGNGADGQVLTFSSTAPSGFAWADTTVSDNSVSTIKLQDASVSNTKLQDNSISSTKLQDASVVSAKIQDTAVTEAKLDAGSGTDGQYLAKDSTAPGGFSWKTPATQTITFSLTSFFKTGTLTTTTGVNRLPIDGTYTIVGTRLMVGTAPTGANIIVDIKKNGTTIYTTQANRPTIASGQNAGGPGATPDVTTLTAGDYLTVDIAQIGSTVAGADLNVSVIVSKAI